VTTVGAGRPDTEVAVILGMDTYLDLHVVVTVDHLTRMRRDRRTQEYIAMRTALPLSSPPIA